MSTVPLGQKLYFDHKVNSNKDNDVLVRENKNQKFIRKLLFLQPILIGAILFILSYTVKINKNIISTICNSNIEKNIFLYETAGILGALAGMYNSIPQIIKNHFEQNSIEDLSYKALLSQFMASLCTFIFTGFLNVWPFFIIQFINLTSDLTLFVKKCTYKNEKINSSLDQSNTQDEKFLLTVTQNNI